MPNHIHIIIEMDKKGTVRRAPTKEEFNKPTPRTIPTIIRYIKAGATKQFYRKYKTNKPLWQRSYYEHIIRNQQELLEIIEYINNNPYNWNIDSLNM